MTNQINNSCCACSVYRERTLEECLIEFCSPTLAGIKCANLFVKHYNSKKELDRNLADLNEVCNPKDVYITTLRMNEHKALLYVYRKNMTEEILGHKKVINFLRNYGYTRNGVEETLEYLKFRIEQSDTFPHEIGIFLGYPYEDVKGFIDNSGKNFIFCGHWKVYKNEKRTRKLFRDFDTCRECYYNSYKKGMSVSRLLVAI